MTTPGRGLHGSAILRSGPQRMAMGCKTSLSLTANGGPHPAFQGCALGCARRPRDLPLPPRLAVRLSRKACRIGCCFATPIAMAFPTSSTTARAVSACGSARWGRSGVLSNAPATNLFGNWNFGCRRPAIAPHLPQHRHPGPGRFRRRRRPRHGNVDRNQLDPVRLHRSGRPKAPSVAETPSSGTSRTGATACSTRPQRTMGSSSATTTSAASTLMVPAGRASLTTLTRHAGGTTALLELDGDGHLDLLLGDVSYPSLTACYMADAIDGQHHRHQRHLASRPRRRGGLLDAFRPPIPWMSTRMAFATSCWPPTSPLKSTGAGALVVSQRRHQRSSRVGAANPVLPAGPNDRCGPRGLSGLHRF